MVEDRREQGDGDVETNPHAILKQNWLRKVRTKFHEGVHRVVTEVNPELLDQIEAIVAGGWKEVEPELSDTFNQTSEDMLTGLYDRRMFFALVEKIILPKMRRGMLHDGTYPHFGYVVMLDIDHFKEVNSTFGHAGGDVVLSSFGKAIKHHFRGDDVIGRVGGDEFIVVAQGIPEEEIRGRMESLRSHFENEPLRLRRVTAPGHPYETAKVAFTYEIAPLADPDDFQNKVGTADNDVMIRKAKRDRRAAGKSEAT